MPYSHIYAHVTGWDGIRRAVLSCFGREGAEPNAFYVPIDLLSNLYLWSWALGSDGKNEIADTIIQNDFLPLRSFTPKRASWGGSGIWLGCLSETLFLGLPGTSNQ